MILFGSCSIQGDRANQQYTLHSSNNFDLSHRNDFPIGCVGRRLRRRRYQHRRWIKHCSSHILHDSSTG